jgi:hypothetical protein
MNTTINNIEMFTELLAEGDAWFGSHLPPFQFNDVSYDGPRANIPSQYEMFNVATQLEARSFIHNICLQSNISTDASQVDTTKIADSLYNKYLTTASINNPGNVN